MDSDVPPEDGTLQARRGSDISSAVAHSPNTQESLPQEKETKEQASGQIAVTTTHATDVDEDLDTGKPGPLSTIFQAVFMRPFKSTSRLLNNYLVKPVLNPLVSYTIVPLNQRVLRPMRSHLLPVESTLWLFIPSALFFILYCAFISVVLLPGVLETLGAVYWNASTTNSIVTVLSQISALLTNAMLKSLLTTVRPALAARRRGTRFSSWIAQGSSGWITAVQLSLTNVFVDMWANFR